MILALRRALVNLRSTQQKMLSCIESRRSTLFYLRNLRSELLRKYNRHSARRCRKHTDSLKSDSRRYLSWRSIQLELEYVGSPVLLGISNSGRERRLASCNSYTNPLPASHSDANGDRARCDWRRREQADSNPRSR